MSKYIVNSPLSHDNKPYAVGDTVEMSDEHAEPLLVLGRIVLMVESAPESGKKASAKKSEASS